MLLALDSVTVHYAHGVARDAVAMNYVPQRCPAPARLREEHSVDVLPHSRGLPPPALDEDQARRPRVLDDEGRLDGVVEGGDERAVPLGSQPKGALPCRLGPEAAVPPEDGQLEARSELVNTLVGGDLLRGDWLIQHVRNLDPQCPLGVVICS